MTSIDENIAGDDYRGDIGVFIDRDGTINRAGPGEYITKWTNFEFLPGALDAIALLSTLSVKIFIVTNQSAIFREMMTYGDLHHIHSMMEFEIVSAGGRIDGIKFCPHTPRDKCLCRKPSAHLYEEIAREHAIDLARSFNIGDSTRDMESGNKVKMTNILVRTGHGKVTETELRSQNIGVDYIVDDLMKASEIVLDMINKQKS